MGSNTTNGLSPRVRGNRTPTLFVSSSNRSIPARTGEPSPTTTRAPPIPVYPRAYGGTRPRHRPPTSYAGLSPRVRGNRAPLARCPAGAGSIPARTGEPSAGYWLIAKGRVYPRAYGGTGCPHSNPASPNGLSPRVRGNPLPRCPAIPSNGSIPRVRGNRLSAVPAITFWRSIPARTGEPGRPVRSSRL